jgi:hypothetical protein
MRNAAWWAEYRAVRKRVEASGDPDALFLLRAFRSEHYRSDPRTDVPDAPPPPREAPFPGRLLL